MPHAHALGKIRVPIRGAYYLAFISFLVILAAPLISPIFPLFQKELVGSAALVGYLDAGFSLLLFLLNFVVAKSLKKYSSFKILKYSSLLYGISFMALVLISNLKQFIF